MDEVNAQKLVEAQVSWKQEYTSVIFLLQITNILNDSDFIAEFKLDSKYSVKDNFYSTAFWNKSVLIHLVSLYIC